MKTKEEISRADKREKEIQIAFETGAKAIRTAFSEATKRAWEEYEQVWKPARKRWESYSSPYFKEMNANLMALTETRDNTLTEARSGWKKCPECGTSASRFQIFCSNEKCEVNLSIKDN